MVFEKPSLLEKVIRGAGRATVGTAKWLWEAVTSVELKPAEDTEAPDEPPDPNEPDYIPPRGWDGEYEYIPPRTITDPDPEDPTPPPPVGEDTDLPPSSDEPFLPVPPIRITPFIFAPDIDINIFPRSPQPQVPITNPPLTIPTLPSRRLPKPLTFFNTTGTTLLENKVISVKEDALSRTYACLMHSPVTASPVPFRLCKRNDNEEPEDLVDVIFEDIENFFKYMFDVIRDSTITIVQFQLCVRAVSLLPATKILKYLPISSPKFVIAVGCAALFRLAEDFSISSKNFDYDLADGRAHKNIKYIDCSPEDEEDEPTEDPYEDLQIGICSDVDADGFIPVRNFRTNEPQQLGMKRQLEVIYEGEGSIDERDPTTKELTGNTITVERLQKVINVPSVKEDITIENIKEAFPEELTFGTVKVETDVSPYGYIRFYANESDVENGNTDELFDDIIDNVVEGTEVPLSRRYSKRVRDQTYGTLTLKLAKLYKWDNQTGLEPIITRFNLK